MQDQQRRLDPVKKGHRGILRVAARKLPWCPAHEFLPRLGERRSKCSTVCTELPIVSKEIAWAVRFYGSAKAIRLRKQGQCRVSTIAVAQHPQPVWVGYAELHRLAHSRQN